MRPFWILLALGLASSGCVFVDDFSTFRSRSDEDAGILEGGADVSIDSSRTGDSSVDSGPSILTRQTFTAGLADALCARGRRCEGKLRVDASSPMRPRPIEEESVVRLFCNPSSRDFAIPRYLPFERINVAFDPALAEACLRALASQRDCIVGGLTGEPACETLFVGLASIGTSCSVDAECLSGRCELSTTACGGSCASVTMGDTCTSNARCGQLFRCRSGTCLPPGRMGQACDQTDDCAPSLWCDPGLRTCQALPDVGGTCVRVPTFGSASTDPCRGSLVCTTSGGTSTCQVGGDLSATCSATTPCRPGTRCGRASTCVAIRSAGEACDSSDNYPYQFSCVNSTCVARPHLGEECSDLNPCVEGGCVAGRCAYLPPGATCGELLGCASYCRTTSTCGPIALGPAPGPTCTTFQDCPREAGGHLVECVGPEGGPKHCMRCP